MFGPVTDTAGGDFITELNRNRRNILSADYPEFPLSTVSYVSHLLYNVALLCSFCFPPSPCSYGPLDVSALAVHTLSITLTTGSTKRDNTNVQKPVQSPMDDWLV